MSIYRAQTIAWNGEVLTGWIIVDDVPVKVAADRRTIHAHAPGFNDALTWEIDRFCGEIFERMMPYFRATAIAARDRSSVGNRRAPKARIHRDERPAA